MGDESPALKAAREGGPKPWSVKPAAGGPPERTTAAALYDTDFPDIPWVVDGILGQGLTVLAGKPKSGKSWLALLIAWAVAAGAAVDGRPTRQGDVLYLALEDTRRRIKDRMRKLHADLGWDVPAALEIATAWPRANDGGLYYVAEWLSDRKPTARLVIVDVLAKFRKPAKGTGGSYDDDYEAVGGLKDLVDHYGCSAVFLHHTRKLRAADPFDELSGTYGISGPADTLWMLDTNGTGEDARLYVRGRDVAEGTIPMSYARASGRWVLGATAEGVDTDGRDPAEPPKKKTRAPRLDACVAWLVDYLAKNGPRRLSTVLSDAEADSFDKKLVFRAIEDAPVEQFADPDGRRAVNGKVYQWLRVRGLAASA